MADYVGLSSLAFCLLTILDNIVLSDVTAMSLAYGIETHMPTKSATAS